MSVSSFWSVVFFVRVVVFVLLLSSMQLWCDLVFVPCQFWLIRRQAIDDIYAVKNSWGKSFCVGLWAGGRGETGCRCLGGTDSRIGMEVRLGRWGRSLSS